MRPCTWVLTVLLGTDFCLGCSMWWDFFQSLTNQMPWSHQKCNEVWISESTNPLPFSSSTSIWNHFEREELFSFSVGQPFQGPYLEINKNPKYKKLKDAIEEKIIIAEVVNKINRANGKVRMLTLETCNDSVSIGTVFWMLKSALQKDRENKHCYQKGKGRGGIN